MHLEKGENYFMLFVNLNLKGKQENNLNQINENFLRA